MGKGHNRRLVGELCVRAKSEHGMKVRVGGGIRTVRTAEQLVGLGVAQIIIGSAAFGNGRPNLAFLKRLQGQVKKKQVLIALDTAKGKIVIHGWRTSLRVSPREVIAALEPYCRGFLCTDVDREGTMRGVNLEWFRELRAATKLPIVAAGGISSLDSYSACNPRQMPRNAAPLPTASTNGLRRACASSAAISAAQWPTPGNTRHRAAAIFSARFVVSTFAPNRCSARSTDGTFPAP